MRELQLVSWHIHLVQPSPSSRAGNAYFPREMDCPLPIYRLQCIKATSTCPNPNSLQGSFLAEYITALRKAEISRNKIVPINAVWRP